MSMTTATLQKKVLDLEAELELIKKSLKKEPDFRIDEKNWEKIKPSVKKIRAKMYSPQYGKR